MLAFVGVAGLGIFLGLKYHSKKNAPDQDCEDAKLLKKDHTDNCIIDNTVPGCIQETLRSNLCQPDPEVTRKFVAYYYHYIKARNLSLKLVVTGDCVDDVNTQMENYRNRRDKFFGKLKKKLCQQNYDVVTTAMRTIDNNLHCMAEQIVLYYRSSQCVSSYEAMYNEIIGNQLRIHADFDRLNKHFTDMFPEKERVIYTRPARNRLFLSLPLQSYLVGKSDMLHMEVDDVKYIPPKYASEKDSKLAEWESIEDKCIKETAKNMLNLLVCGQSLF